MIKDKKAVKDYKEVANRSKTYLLPLLAEVINLPKTIINGSLINTYIEDPLGNYKGCIFLYFKYDIRNPRFTHFENELFKSEYFVESFDMNDRVLYILKFPKEYMPEYGLYKKGLYSQFGVDSKVLIIKYLNVLLGSNEGAVKVVKKVKQILYKDVKLREKIEEDLKVRISPDQELGQKYDKEKETFNFDLIYGKSENEEVDG